MIHTFTRSHLLLFPLTILLLSAFFGACNRNEDQDQFEHDAFRTPEGFTGTNSSGEITGSVDPDDWRISPMFEGFVEVHLPAHPNPTQGEDVRIELQITGIEAVNGLEVLTLVEPNEFRQLYSENSGVLDPGFLNFSFNPTRFSRSGAYADARGLNRVFIYDQNQNLITYGDVMVE